MPNHITNQLTFNGDAKEIELLVGKYTTIYDDPYTRFPDFEKVIPSPANMVNDNVTKEQEMELKLKGIPCWYTWQRENWGTKWNCYQCEKVSDVVFRFQTAWNSVRIIIQRISFEFPNISICYEWSDEDTGYNCGYMTFANGETTIKVFANGSNEAYEFAFKLNPSCKEYYELAYGGYVPVEDE